MPKYRNKVRCKFCGDIIESKSLHDFVRCKCGKISVDGGQDYAKFSFPAGMKFADCVEVIREPVDKE
jgi:hypothetical protein